MRLTHAAHNQALGESWAYYMGHYLADKQIGYTNQQMFNAFQPGIYNLQDYRIKLLQQNNYNQSTGVNSLFSQYGY